MIYKTVSELALSLISKNAGGQLLLATLPEREKNLRALDVSTLPDWTYMRLKDNV